MTYILDTNIFRKLLDHFPRKGKLFTVVWENIETGIITGEYISVDECYNEMTRHYSEKSENYEWLKNHKKMFLSPTNEESLILKDLFLNKKMQESIHSKNILLNRPSADPYLVAKAKSLNAVIVTEEKFKPNSAQLPNLCEALGVKWITYDDFMDIVTSK